MACGGNAEPTAANAPDTAADSVVPEINDRVVDTTVPDTALPEDTAIPPEDTAAPALPVCEAGLGAGETHKDLVYSTVHERHKLDLYLPLEPGPVPLIIWVHGGGWKAGSKDGLKAVVQPYMSRGFAVASVGYRLSDHDWPAQIADVRAAVRWLRVNADTYGLDAAHFGAWGSSAGGHLVAMLGVSADVASLDDPALGNGEVSCAVQAVVDYYGPSEILTMDADAVAAGCPAGGLCHLCEDSPEALLLDCDGGPPGCPDKAAEASPITHASADDAAFVVVHGEDDCTVPAPQGQRMHDALTAAGVESTHFQVPGAGHNSNEVSTPEVTAAVAQFLDRTLRGCETTEFPEPPKQPNSPPAPTYETVDECQLDQCPEEYNACQSLTGCPAVEDCFRDCLKAKQGGCVAQCASDLTPDLFQTHKSLFSCAKGKGCYELLL